MNYKVFPRQKPLRKQRKTVDITSVPSVERILLLTYRSTTFIGHVAMSEPINLITTLYVDYDSARQDEHRECLRRNIENTHITRIFVLVERGADLEPLLKHPKVVALVVPVGRQTYSNFISIANHYCQEEVVVFSHSDIFFDDTISATPRFLRGDTLFAMTRRELQTDGSAPWSLSQQSSDAWALRAPITATNTQIEIGQPESDSLFVGRMIRAGYSVQNISLDINCFHMHLSQKHRSDRNGAVHRKETEMAYPVISGIAPKRACDAPTAGPIVVDGVALTQNSKNASFWLSVFMEWQEGAPKSEVIVLDRSGSTERPHTLITCDAPPLSNDLISSVREVNGVMARKLGASLFLSTGDSTALGVPSVVLATSAIPELLRLDIDTFQYSRGLSFHLADFVLCASPAIREVLEERYHHIGSSKFIDAPMWLGLRRVLATFPPEERASARQKLKLAERFVVFAGDRTPALHNANLQIVAHALREIGSLGIVFIGGALHLEESVRSLFQHIPVRHISEDAQETILTLAAAEAFVMPQLGEEEGEWTHVALAASCPVVRSRWHHTHRDGLGTIFFSPHSPDGLVAILRTLIGGAREAVGLHASLRVAEEAKLSNAQRIMHLVKTIQHANSAPLETSRQPVQARDEAVNDSDHLH